MASTDIQNRAESGTEDSKLKATVEGVLNGESPKENGDKELSNGTESTISKEKDEIVSQKDVQTDGELVNGRKYEERESIETEENIDVVGDDDELVELEKEKEIKESDKVDKTRIVQVLLEESRESPTSKAQLSEKLNDSFCKEENNTKMTNEIITPDFTRSKYGAGFKMSGRRPLRGIVSPHPASKRKASYSINDSPNKKKIKESTSSEGSRWNYFSSPFRFWNYKENCTSTNSQQVSPNDSMVVNVDDLSMINNRIDDSQFENDWPEGNKPFWKMCNIM